LQIDAEIIRVDGTTSDKTQYLIDRGLGGSTATAHAAGASAIVLTGTLHVIPLGTGFFSNPNYTDFQYRLLFPNQRIAASELYLENSKGTGPAQATCFLANGTNGLHTYEGGTIVLQASGALGIESAAASSITLDRTRVVRDVQALVDSAPVGGPVNVVLNANGQAIATLVVPAGSVQSAVFSPTSALVLSEGSKLNFDITCVPQGAGTSPGKNVAVQIRT
jgi:hypothetical protein